MRDDAPTRLGYRAPWARFVIFTALQIWHFGLGWVSCGFRGEVLKLSKAILIRTASVLCALMLIVPFGFGRTSHSKSAHSKSTKSAAKSNTSAHVSKATAKTSRHGKKGKNARKARGQQGIDPDRTREIQSA